MEFLYKEHKISWSACIAVKKQTPDDQEKNQDSEEELKLDPRTDIVEMPNREGSLPDPGHPAEPYCSLKKFYFISTPEILDTATVRIFNSYYMRNSVSYAFSQRALKEVEFQNQLEGILANGAHRNNTPTGLSDPYNNQFAEIVSIRWDFNK